MDFRKYLSIIFLFLTHPILHAQPTVGGLLLQLKNSKTDSAKIFAYDAISKHYMYVMPDSAIYYAEQGLALAGSKEYTYGEGAMLLQLGSIYEKHNKLEPGKEKGTLALEKFEAANDTNGIGAVNSLLGVIAAKKGDLKGAAQHLLKALRLFEQIKKTSGIVQTLIKLGIINEQNNNLDKALEYYNKAQELNKNQPVGNASFTLMNSIGIVYAKKGNMQRALEYFEEGVSLTDTPRHAGVHIALLGSLGNAYKELGREKEAIEVQYRVLRKAREFDIPEEIARALINLATLFDKTDPGKSISYLQEAIGIANEIEIKQLSIDAYLLLSDIYEAQGNYKGALEVTRKYEDLEDTLLNAEKSSELAELQATYELDKSKVQIENLKLDNQKRTLERDLVITIAIGCIVLVVVLWSFFRHTRKLNKSLEESNHVKDRLFSIIGHDLRSPMNSVVQTLDLMQLGMLTKEEETLLVAELKKHSELTLETLNSLLQWGKTQLKGVQLNKVRFTSKEIINQNIEGLHTIAAQKGITITDLTNGHEVFADADHFNFVVRNLLSNAIKFSHPHGNIEIKAQSNIKADTVIFSIKDKGVGISKERLQHIFDTDTSQTQGTSGEKGTGLGLMLCREFVKANGGNIWADSAPGDGTTFSFSLKNGEQ